MCIRDSHWGISLTFFPSSVASVVFAALPWTIGLVGVTTVLAFILGTLIGIFGAWNRGKLFDSLLPPIFIVLSAFPYFFVGLMAILLFSVKLGWFPTSGAYTNGVNPAFDWSYICLLYTSRQCWSKPSATFRVDWRL